MKNMRGLAYCTYINFDFVDHILCSSFFSWI
jgi:hypothetical protein